MYDVILNLSCIYPYKGKSAINNSRSRVSYMHKNNYYYKIVNILRHIK